MRNSVLAPLHLTLVIIMTGSSQALLIIRLDRRVREGLPLEFHWLSLASRTLALPPVSRILLHMARQPSLEHVPGISSHPCPQILDSRFGNV